MASIERVLLAGVQKPVGGAAEAEAQQLGSLRRGASPTTGFQTSGRFSPTLSDWVDSFQCVCSDAKRILTKAAKSQKNQADKKQGPQETFHVGDKCIRLPSILS